VRDGIAELGPRDHIDVQTFFYVVGQTGYVDRASAQRRAWLAKLRCGEPAVPSLDVTG
jgi:hypothetical protein